MKRSTCVYIFFKNPSFPITYQGLIQCSGSGCAAPKPTTSASSGKLGKFRSTESESLGIRPGILYFNKPFR